MREVRKTFGGTVALSGVDFDLNPGEVHAIIGENGAGKSTLMKILCGVYPMDGGSILVEGEPVRIQLPKDALALGINMIHQEFANFSKLSVAENVFVGRLPRKAGFPLALDSRDLLLRTAEVLGRLRLPIDPGIVKVQTGLKTPLGRLLLTNSITLTPGTITVEMKGPDIYVHWINVQDSDPVAATKAIVGDFEKYLEVN